MAGTDYRAYIEQQMEQQRAAAEEQNQGSNLPALAGAAAVVAGAASLRHRGVRSGIRETLANNGMPGARQATAANMQRAYRGSSLEQTVEGAKASVKAMDDTLDRRGPRQLFQKQEAFEQQFRNHLDRRLDESPAATAGGQPEALALDERLQQLRTSLRQSKKQYTDAIRYNDTVNAAKRNVGERHQGAVERMFAGLDETEERLLDAPSQGAVDQMLRRYEKGGDRADALRMEFDGDADRNQFVDGLFKALDEHAKPERYMGDAERRRLKFGTEDGTEQGWDKFRQQIMDGFMRDNQEPDDFFSRSMKNAGYKHASVRDLQDAGMMDDYGRKVANSQGERVDSRFESKFKKMTSLDARFGDLAADPHVFKNSDGEILDMRRTAKSTYDGLAGFKENFEIPYLKFNPLDLAQFGTYQSIREAPQNYRFKRGTTQTFLGERTNTVDSVDPKRQDARIGVLSQDYYYTGGRAIDPVSGQTAADDIYLSSARFGMTPRMAAGVGNLHERDLSSRGPIKRLFDVGGQENDSAYRRIKQTMGKKNDPNWAPNALRRVREGAAATTTDQVQDFRIIYGNVNKHATPLSDDAASFVDNTLGGADDSSRVLQRDNMRNQEGVETAFQEARRRVAEKPEASRTDVDKQLLQEWDQMQRNPQAFWGTKRVRTNRMPEVPFPFQSYDPSDSRLIGKSEDVHRLVDEWKVEEADRRLRREGSSLGRSMQDSVADGSLPERALDETRNLKNLGRLRTRKNNVFSGTPEQRDRALEGFQADMQNRDVYRPMAATIDQFNPRVGTGPGDGPVDYFGQAEYLAVNKAKGGEHARNKYQELVDSGQHPLMAGAKAGAEVAGQPFAGRRRPDQVTTASMGSYYYAERLDSALSGMGLGLSQKNRGSMQAIMGGHVGRRLALPFATLEMAEYGDQMTGGVISDTMINTYTQMYTDMGTATEFLGLNDVQEDIAGNLPGLDRVGGWPISGAVKYASFGAIGDTRDGEELDFYWDHGEDPVRKGRWWAFGSDTPWEGGKIDRYEPNWARRQTSDYEYSENMYGSPDEYFGNHWMPTPTNPLAPIRHFITDTDHYEEKHKDSRPYPYTGGFAELDMIPIAGPALNNTIGRVLKPAEQHHDLEQANEDYLDTLSDRIGGETVGGAMKMLPGGGYSLLADPFGTTDGGNYQGASSGGVPIGRGDDVALGSVDRAEGVSGRIMLPPEGSEGPALQSSSVATTATYSKAEIEAINAGYRGATEETDASTTTTMEDLRDAETIADLNSIRMPRGVSATARDTWYSASELGGIYGFGANSILGWDQRLNEMTWEDSSSMFGFADRFWDMELGGLGGEMSEIGRRYNPRDARANTYNPIRNEMPSWMPGPEAYTDFMHGDPYCVSPDTLITTPDGLIRADAVNENTVIKTHKGNWRQVEAIQVRPVGAEEKVYEFTVATLPSMPFKASEEHPVLVARKKDAKQRYWKEEGSVQEAATWVTAEDIDVGDYAAYPLPHREEQEAVIDLSEWADYPHHIVEDKLIVGHGSAQHYEIMEFLRQEGIPSFKRGERKVFLAEKDWEAKCYENAVAATQRGEDLFYSIDNDIYVDNTIAAFLGYYLAEGSASINDGLVSLAFHEDETEYHREVVDALDAMTGRTASVRDHKHNKGVSIYACSKPLSYMLRGLFGPNAREKQIPQWVHNLPEEQLYHFLRAYINGDGSYFEEGSRSRVSIKTASKQLAYAYREILLSLGFVANIVENKEQTSTYQGQSIVSGISFNVSVNGAQAKDLARRIGYEVKEHDGQAKAQYFMDGDYLFLRINKKEEMTSTDVPYVYGFEVGVDDSFCVAGVATHNTKVAKGEMRLPGDAYEKIHELNPEEGFGKYGPLDRFMILADVAPQSEQYDLYRNIVQEMNTNDQLDDTQSKLYEQTRDQVVESRKKYKLYPYKFKNADINKETVTVTEVVDAETFYTKEYPNRPLKMAGIDVDSEHEEAVNQVVGETVKEGARIEVGLDADPLHRENDDMRTSMDAVVYSEGNSWDMFYTSSKGQSLNARVARMKEGGFLGLLGGESVAEKEDDGSATATRALYDDGQVSMGKAWEWLTHTGLPETPIFGPVFDKFISTQSPLEAYKDKEIYGKSFKSWGRPVEDWIQPMMQTAATKNPLLATAQGAGFGSLFGGIGSAFTQKRGLGKMKVGTYYGGIAGAAAFGATASIRAIGERIGRTVDDEATYIPNKVKKEREVNEYYDRLKYVKYKGLYNKAKERVEDNTGVDLDELLAKHQEEADQSSREQAYLEESKNFLQRHKDMGFAGDTELSEKLKETRDQIAEAEMPDQVRNLGPDAMQALQYKQTYESTLHGADPYGDFQSIFRALPDSDREFYEHFMNAAPGEREEILRLVPDNQKKFYQARWGMEVDEPESNRKYFSEKKLPSADWGGWSPKTSLEAIKVKTVKNEAMDLKEFNLWEDAEEQAAQTPVSRPGMDQRPSMMLDTNSLTQVLQGAGLTDAEVTMQISERSDGNNIGVGINLMKDRSQDFVNTLNEEIGGLLAQ